MARLTLVRHGRAAAGFDEDTDPGLHEEGRSQAAAMASVLGPQGPLRLVTSPLRRTRQTAAALEGAWGVAALVEPAVGEIPSPGLGVGERGAWLATVLSGRWEGLDRPLQAWRDGVVEALLGLGEDAVVVTHFVAINAAVGAATDDPRVTCFRPGYCSWTVLESDGRRLGLVSLGEESSTVVR